MDVIKNNFRGKAPLWQVFWIQNILIGGLLQYGVEKVAPHLSTVPIYLLIVFAVLYSLWVTVGMWQCAFNAKWKGWGYIVRGFFIAIIAVVAITYLRNL
jgi:hypothetical protein